MGGTGHNGVHSNGIRMQGLANRQELNMLEEFEDWARKNIECCACGGPLEKSSCINIVELKKLATWKFPVFGHIDIPGYGPRALAIVCNECMKNKIKIRHCIEWEGSPYLVKYHDVDDLKDAKKSASQMDYYFGRLFQQRMALRAAKQESIN